jgi:NAD+ synthetase
MKVRLQQLNPVIGDLSGNKSLIIEALRSAEQAGIDLLILPEMCVTGYPAQDLLEINRFRDECYRINNELIDQSKSTALLFGSITPNEKEFGRKMYNSAILAKEGELLGLTHKTLLPTYDIFDDLRYFEPNRDFQCMEFHGFKLGVTICEDIWYNENEVQYHTYETDPALNLKKAGADVIINISASPFTGTKHENRVRMIQNHAKKLKLPVLYSNQVGAHTDIVFDGDSQAIDRDGNVIACTRAFEPASTDIELLSGGDCRALDELPENDYPGEGSHRYFTAIKRGLQDYLKKTGITEKVVLGLSGGIDSALVCALAVESLGADRVTAITMPTEFSSTGSVSDSQKLAKNLGIELIEIPIQPIFSTFREQLKPVFNDLPFGVAEENLQSRIRGSLLMTYANKFGHFLLPTGNKSEYAVGYATLYGDMNGALAIIGDLYKTEVYKLSNWLNRELYQEEIIPESILTKPPSAELRPDQKDSDSLPDYEVLDDILYHYIELQKSYDQIIDLGHKPKIVRKITNLVDYNEFKRFQAAPILKLHSKSFGTGRRWPIVQGWTSEHF